MVHHTSDAVSEFDLFELLYRTDPRCECESLTLLEQQARETESIT